MHQPSNFAIYNVGNLLSVPDKNSIASAPFQEKKGFRTGTLSLQSWALVEHRLQHPKMDLNSSCVLTAPDLPYPAVLNFIPHRSSSS